MKKVKVYLSGAISGRDRKDYLKQFADAEKHLRELGYDVCNPTKALPCRFLWIYKILGYKLTLLYDLWLLSRCDKIYMLIGSENSKGAFLEKVAAGTFGIPKIFVADFHFSNNKFIVKQTIRLWKSLDLETSRKWTTTKICRLILS